MEYFPSMIMMMKQVELEEESINNVFPLRSGIIPSYIRLDTITLVPHRSCPQPLLGSVELHPQGLFKTTSVQQGLTGKKGYDISY